MNAFKGTGVALITPFLEDQSIDFDSLKRLIDHVIAGGVDYLVVLGTTGEAATLSLAEKQQVLQACVAHNQGRVPLVLGLGGNNTQACLEEINTTEFYGVAALLSVSPYYSKPSQAGILAHYQTLADASPVPVILYNIPGRTMSNLAAETTLALSHHPNIVGIKEASGNLEQCMQIAAAMPKDFLLVSGDDMLTLPMQRIGGSGVISVLANALPATFKTMTHGKEAESLAAAFSLLALNGLMYLEGNPVGIKSLLHQLGICTTDQVRLPLLRASQSLSTQIQHAQAK